MAWALDDTLLGTIVQRYLNQTIKNTLTYVITLSVNNPNMAAIFTDLANQLTDILVPMQSTALQHTEQRFDNLTNGLDFYVADIVKSGTVSGTDVMASFSAVGMRKSVSDKTTRPGSIRVCGLVESNVDGNDLDATYEALCATQGNFLAQSLTTFDGAGGSVVFTPIVVGRDAFGDFDLTRRSIIEDVISPKLTTQNSRKPNRGE